MARLRVRFAVFGAAVLASLSVGTSTASAHSSSQCPHSGYIDGQEWWGYWANSFQGQETRYFSSRFVHEHFYDHYLFYYSGQGPDYIHSQGVLCPLH